MRSSKAQVESSQVLLIERGRSARVKVNIVWTPLNEEQHSVRLIYSMMIQSQKLHLLYVIAQVDTIAGKMQSRGRERTREKEERVRDCMLWFWHWS
jgi:hypothetical protein